MTEPKKNGLRVAVTNGGKSVGAAIYSAEIDPDTGQHTGNGTFLAGVALSPDQAYAIAREFTICAMKVEENQCDSE